MAKNILFISYYFQPDLSAGSFRNTLIVELLDKKLNALNADSKIIVITSLPSRYSSYNVTAKEIEYIGKRIIIYRVNTGKHQNGFIDQIKSFSKYFIAVFRIQRKYNYDLIYASSSRLMTAFLAAILSRIYSKKLYLDIRDIFRESIRDVLKSILLRKVLDRFIRIIESFTFRTATTINVVTPEMADYFSKFNNSVRCFTNGIDEMFFTYNFTNQAKSDLSVITFAGNVGKAQALEKVLPDFAKEFEGKIKINVIGDGSGKQMLIRTIQHKAVTNILLFDPVERNKILEFYRDSDFLFLHLDDKEAFYKAMPTKLFEYAATGKPIIAGLKGFAKSFAEKNIPNTILFDSNDVEELIKKFKGFKEVQDSRKEFLEKYRRKKILTEMVEDITQHIEFKNHAEL